MGLDCERVTKVPYLLLAPTESIKKWIKMRNLFCAVNICNDGKKDPTLVLDGGISSTPVQNVRRVHHKTVYGLPCSSVNVQKYSTK